MSGSGDQRTRAEILALVEDFLDSSWSTLDLTTGGVQLALRRLAPGETPPPPPPVAASPPVPAQAAPRVAEVGPATASAADRASDRAGDAASGSVTSTQVADSGTGTAADGSGGAGPGAPGPGEVDVVAPVMGVFYRAPSPGAEPFTKLGAAVTAGQSLCIVEVMKLMNEIKSEVSGEVVAIFAEDGEPVDADAPLFRIRTAGAA